MYNDVVSSERLYKAREARLNVTLGGRGNKLWETRYAGEGDTAGTRNCDVECEGVCRRCVRSVLRAWGTRGRATEDGEGKGRPAGMCSAA